MNNQFSWSAAREARIDRAIDRAVRDMMQVDPPAGLRRRVLAQIAEPHRRRSSLLPRYALAALAVLVILSVAMLQQRVDAPTPPKAPSIVATSIPLVEPPPSGTIEPVPSAPSVAVTPKITREAIRMPHVTNVFGNRGEEITAAGTDTTRAGRASGVRRLAPESLPRLRIVPLSARPIVLPSRLAAPSKTGR